jgi:hypothetical protein
MDERQPRHQVVLRLGEFETTLASARRTDVLTVGWRRTADDWFVRRSGVPTAAELEQAIMAVEDEIARVARRGDASSPLVSDDTALVELARLAGVGGALPLRVDVAAVENIFERLARVAQGGPLAASGLPDGEAGRAFAARLLIVRELMHHLGFATLVADA